MKKCNGKRTLAIVLAIAMLMSYTPVYAKAKNKISLSSNKISVVKGTSASIKVKTKGQYKFKSVKVVKIKNKKVAKVTIKRKKITFKGLKVGKTKITFKVKYKYKQKMKNKEFKVTVVVRNREISTTMDNSTTESTTFQSTTESITTQENVHNSTREETSEEISEETSEEVSEEPTEGTSEEVSEEPTEGTSEEVSEEDTEETSEEVSEEPTEGTSEEVSEENTEETSEETNGNTTESNLAEKQLDFALNSLKITYQSGDYERAVTKDVTLGGIANETVSVQWNTSNQDVIDTSGKVTRPLEQDCQVTLTATVTLNDISKEKEFLVTVIADNKEEIKDIPVVSGEALLEMNEENEYFSVATDETNSFAKSIIGNIYSQPVVSSEDALCAIQSLHELTGIDDVENEIQCSFVNHDDTGTVFRFQLYYKGVKVYGRQVTLVTDAADNASVFISSYIDIGDMSVEPYVSAEEAENIVKEDCSGLADISSTELIVYAVNENQDNPILAYLIRVDSTATESKAAFQGDYIIDASTGNIVEKNSSVCNGIGDTDEKENLEEEYMPVDENGKAVELPDDEDEDGNLFDIERNIIIKSYGTVDEFQDPVVASAYNNVKTAYDWWNEKKVIHGLNDNGAKPLTVEVHVDNGADNAQWVNNGDDDNLIQCFDNDKFKGRTGENNRTMAASLNMMAHEYAHGVADRLSGKDSSFFGEQTEECTAISEAYADIFSCFMTGELGVIDQTWIVADDLFVESEEYDSLGYAKKNGKSSPSGKIGRNIFDPTISGNLMVYSDYKSGKTSAHTASTIISRMAYLMEQDNVLSREELFELWYQSLRLGYDKDSVMKDVPERLCTAAYLLWSNDTEKLKTVKRSIYAAALEVELPVKFVYRVIDAQTNEPIENAEVRCKRKLFGLLFIDSVDNIKTDEDGRAVFVVDGNEEYEFSFEAEGYETIVSTEVKYVSGDEEGQEIRLKPLNPDDSAYYLKPGESITLHNSAEGWLNVIVWNYEVKSDSEAEVQSGSGSADTYSTGSYFTDYLRCTCDSEPDKVTITCTKGVVRVPKPQEGDWRKEVLDITITYNGLEV